MFWHLIITVTGISDTSSFSFCTVILLVIVKQILKISSAGSLKEVQGEAQYVFATEVMVLNINGSLSLIVGCSPTSS